MGLRPMISSCDDCGSEASVCASEGEGWQQVASEDEDWDGSEADEVGRRLLMVAWS